VKRTCNGCRATQIVYAAGLYHHIDRCACDLGYPVRTVGRWQEGKLHGEPMVECPKPMTYSKLFESEHFRPAPVAREEG